MKNLKTFQSLTSREAARDIQVLTVNIDNEAGMRHSSRAGARASFNVSDPSRHR